jgi:hypothetical protein
MPRQRQFLPDLTPISADDPRMKDPEFAARHRKFDAWYSKYQAYNNAMVTAAQYAAKQRQPSPTH